MHAGVNIKENSKYACAFLKKFENSGYAYAALKNIMI